MRNLRTVIAHHMAGVTVLGGEKHGLDRESLRTDLASLRQGNITAFWLCAAMVVVLFVAALTASFLRLDSPTLVQLIQGIFGITASGLIVWMFRLWREKLLTETLIAMAVNGSEDALRQLLVITQHVLLGGRSIATNSPPDHGHPAP